MPAPSDHKQVSGRPLVITPVDPRRIDADLLGYLDGVPWWTLTAAEPAVRSMGTTTSFPQDSQL
jgi:hypothetical protein